MIALQHDGTRKFFVTIDGRSCDGHAQSCAGCEWRRSCPADPQPENDITDLAAETLQYVALERNHHLKSRAGLKTFYER